MLKSMIGQITGLSGLLGSILNRIQTVLGVFGVLFEARDGRLEIPDLLFERLLRLGVGKGGLLRLERRRGRLDNGRTNPLAW
jgi:hypothetical protein